MKTHISLNVSDIDKSVGFYKKMFGIEPVKYYKRDSEAHLVIEDGVVAGSASAKTGYAKFDIEQPPLNLVLNETEFTKGGSLSHLGLQVASTDEVKQYDNRWKEAGLITVEEKEVVCCYAQQDKTWVHDPDGNEWEAFVVLADVPPAEAKDAAGCCGPVAVIASVEEAKEECCDAPVQKEGEPAAACC